MATRCPAREMWLEALPYHKEFAPPDAPPLAAPTDDNDRCGFMDDLLFTMVSLKGGAAMRLYPRDRMGLRPLLKRVYKKVADDGRENPNYGRWYLTNNPECHLKYFEWLTETMWWKSYAFKMINLVDHMVGLLDITGQSASLPLWDEKFEALYTCEKSLDEIARHKVGIPVSQVRTPLSLPRVSPGRASLVSTGERLPVVEQYHKGTGRAALEGGIPRDPNARPW